MSKSRASTKSRKSKKSKKKVIIPLSPVDMLGPINYHSGDPVSKRRQRLIKGVNKYSYKPIVLRLNAMAIRFKNTQPKLHENIRGDMAYLKKIYK